MRRSIEYPTIHVCDVQVFRLTFWLTERRLRCRRDIKIDEGESLMALYGLPTYTLYVGKMAEATKLYQELGFPALKKGGHDDKLLG